MTRSENAIDTGTREALDGSDNSHSEHSSRFQVGGAIVEITSERSTDVALGASLAPFRTHAEVPQIDISIAIEWVANLTLTDGRRRLFDSGAVWRLYEGSPGFEFDFSAPALRERPYKRFLVDSQFRRATLQMSEECFAAARDSADPLEYPLDELLIMHRLTQEQAIELHGCGIVSADGVGNLFVGHSGAGKSTTTRLWTAQHDVEILSDDRIIVRRDENKSVAGTPVRATCDADGKGILRLRDRSALRSCHSAQDDKAIPIAQDNKTIRMYGTPWHGEAMYASPSSAPLTRILVLEHGQSNVLTRLTKSQAVAELFARSFVPFHRHEYVDNALNCLEHVTESVPCYRYAFEPDQRAVEKILQFND